MFWILAGTESWGCGDGVGWEHGQNETRVAATSAKPVSYSKSLDGILPGRVILRDLVSCRFSHRERPDNYQLISLKLIGSNFFFFKYHRGKTTRNLIWDHTTNLMQVYEMT